MSDDVPFFLILFFLNIFRVFINVSFNNYSDLYEIKNSVDPVCRQGMLRCRKYIVSRLMELCKEKG